MSNVFWQRQLLCWQIIEQCMMLNADVRKGEGQLVKCRQGRGYEKGSFFADVIYRRPYSVPLLVFWKSDLSFPWPPFYPSQCSWISWCPGVLSFQVQRFRNEITITDVRKRLDSKDANSMWSNMTKLLSSNFSWQRSNAVLRTFITGVVVLNKKSP